MKVDIMFVKFIFLNANDKGFCKPESNTNFEKVTQYLWMLICEC